jgi:hypothetical protein
MSGTQVQNALAYARSVWKPFFRAHAQAPEPAPVSDDTGQPRATSRTGPLVRVSLVASVLAHAAIVIAAVIQWGSPTPLAATPPPSVAVDLVSPQEAPPAPVPEQPQLAALAQELAKLQPPAPEPVLNQPSRQERTDRQPRPNQPKPDLAKPERPSPGAANGHDPTPLNPTFPSDNALGPGWVEGARQAPTTTPSVDLGNSPSEIRAKLTRDTVAEFKAHLDKCWVPVSGGTGAAKLKLVVRIGLRPDGRLAAAPEVLDGPNPTIGIAPVFFKSVIRALQQCQPYNFLPASKYKEWKILDLSFTPDGLLGG